MIPTVLLIVAGVSLVSLVLSFLLTILVGENARFVSSRMECYASGDGPPTPPVTLVVPVKGPDLELEQNLAALLQLDYPDYELRFVVEAETDPAVPLIRQLVRQAEQGRGTFEGRRIPAQLVIAGLSNTCGQKVHNLREATESTNPNRVLAFADADARPGRPWLRQLLSQLSWNDEIGASSGYRWMVPENLSLPNLILYAANSAVAALPGRHALNLVWGGSWAIRADVFESIEIRDAWRGTLSDDLVATRVLWDAGLRIEYEPGCLCASPVNVNWSQMLEFLRRQFLICRRYTPRHWLGGLVYSSLVQLPLILNLALAIVFVASGEPTWWIPGATAALLYGFSSWRAATRQRMARTCLPPHADKLAAAGWFDILLGPLAGVVTWATLISSCFGTCIRWRGNRYRIHRGGQIELLETAQRTAQIATQRHISATRRTPVRPAAPTIAPRRRRAA